MSEVQGAVTAAETEGPDGTTEQRYTRNNPYQSTVVLNYVLSGPGSEKETRHLAFALDESMTYTPGDSLGVLPENRAEAVAEVLEALGFTGQERVLDHYKAEISFEEALRNRLSIGKLARGSVGLYAKLTGAEACGGKGHGELMQLCGPANKARAEEYCWGREFIDLLHDFPGVISEPQQLFNVLQRLVPRLYSISSSQLVHPDTAETTVRVVRYNTHNRERHGVASTQLGMRAHVGTKLPVFLHANQNFRLPDDPSTPIIMVGPGTGVAPFRAFLEDRQATGASGENWLIFGDQHRASDFLYEDQFLQMQQDGTLTRLDTAFSRDQAHKIYVQDRMREHAAELSAWIERGAYFYVCGDAVHMAKSVEEALTDAIAQGRSIVREDAAAYVDAMKKQRRYQRDVY
jgi:sulfite reductase (NADPH) flavoprotein alpha-component